ncbi:synaptotagmin-5-like [Canna indica]|uniref:Synaptotagmin-5-like n=1 Tax=Canna indica TaxID=4628 RepID=A0AAQ3Q3D4_9LILI|nr:synaptotagmin-5-like [Canna indica]
MGFFIGLLLGVALGVGLVMGFARSENARSKRRSELAATVAAFSRMTVEDTRKLLPGEWFPSWVIFSQRQKFSYFLPLHLYFMHSPLFCILILIILSLQLNWLNAELAKIWPYVNEAASDLIRTSVEPVLEQYRPAILAALKFSKLTLGTVAPQFTGVSIIEEDKSGITMELELQWDGNPNIILDIKTLVGVALPIQVKDIGFTGIFRLIFKPLVEEIPCFGAVSYSLREKTKLDFTLKVIGGDLSALPGISDAIEETIRDAVEDSITWPVRKVVPILPGDYSDLELKPVGILEVKLVQARDLTNKDIIGKSDPFTVLYIRPLRDRTKTSKTINNDLNPIWNEHYEFIVEDVSTQSLTVKIYDDEGIQPAEFIGCAQVKLKDLQPGKVKDIWLKLVKDLVIQRDRKNRGQVHLELLYCPFGMKTEFTSRFATEKFSMTSLEKALKSSGNGIDAANIDRAAGQKKKEIIVRGVLSVTVISAENLPSMDVLGKADPFVVIRMKKSDTKNKTRVVNNSLNPIWNQTFDIVVEDALHDLLMLEVFDHDTFGKDYMGRCIMTLTRVMLEGEVRDSFPLEGTTNGSLNLYLKWAAQPIYRDSS